MAEYLSITRKIDGVGRFVLPMEFRVALDLQEGDDLEVTADLNMAEITLKKKAALCIVCRSADNLKKLNSNFYVCERCVEKLREAPVFVPKLFVGDSVPAADEPPVLSSEDPSPA